MFCITIGDPIHGFEQIGPFETRQEAQDWADDVVVNLTPDWWMVELYNPSQAQERIKAKLG